MLSTPEENVIINMLSPNSTDIMDRDFPDAPHRFLDVDRLNKVNTFWI